MSLRILAKLASKVPSPMHLPPLQLISDHHFSTSGDVVIHPSAAIAPGVLLQADPGSQIIIAAGVCIGAGTILHAHQGMLEVETGATLGASVLMIGNGKIGKNACVGSSVLIWSTSVEAEQVIPAGVLIGDAGRQADLSDLSSTPATPSPAAAATNPVVYDPPRGANVQVYGKAALDRLMASLFPHHQSLNSLPSTHQSSDNDQTG